MQSALFSWYWATIDILSLRVIIPAIHSAWRNYALEDVSLALLSH